MKLDKSMKILIVGLGLMGGSYAAALTREGYCVSAVSDDRDSVEYALKKGIIKNGAWTVDEKIVSEADVVIFALYPHTFIEWVREHGNLIKTGAVVTDVTGVKCGIVDRIQELLKPGAEFIAAHPMAGREVCGVRNSDPDIFKGANYIIVPTGKNTPGAIELCRNLGEILGFERITELSPKKHDEMVAFVSQLTHCIAVSLMCACDDPELVRYTGDSFRDLTRIANINDVMWSELFLTNRVSLLEEMDRYRSSFDKLYGYIKTGDREGIREMMRISSARRKNFDIKG